MDPRVRQIPWRREWLLTPVFLSGESQGRGSLVGCHLWGRTESDTTEVTEQQHSKINKLILKKETSYLMCIYFFNTKKGGGSM